MGYFDDDYESYYEPTEFDIISNEFVNKMKDCLKQEVKDYYLGIQKVNEYLKKQNEELKKKDMEVCRKEIELNSKLKTLEHDFMRSKFSEKLKPFEKDFYVYYADSSSKMIPKCNLCDDNREVTFTSPSGKTVKQRCECNKSYTYYKPKKTKIINLWLSKDSWNNRPFTITAKYQDNRDDEHYCDFKINEVIEKFIEENAEHYQSGDWKGSTGFTTKEECKKYCDWLNKKRGNEIEEDVEPESCEE
jgi:hypothetical protein